MAGPIDRNDVEAVPFLLNRQPSARFQRVRGRASREGRFSHPNRLRETPARQLPRYGRAEHGRKGGSGLLGTFSKRQPRPLTADRQARFSRLKERSYRLRTAGTKGIAGVDISGSSVRSASAWSEPPKLRLDRLPKVGDFGGSASIGSKFYDAAPLAERSREGEPMGKLTTPYPAAGRF
jgi:hypothetical protein